MRRIFPAAFLPEWPLPGAPQSRSRFQGIAERLLVFVLSRFRS